MDKANKRNIGAEILQGLRDMKAHQSGKRRLRTHQIDPMTVRVFGLAWCQFAHLARMGTVSARAAWSGASVVTRC